MATNDLKISQLTAYTTPINTDLLPIVDITTSITKKITFNNLQKAILSYTQTATTGSALNISRNLAAASTDSPLVSINNQNAGDDQYALLVQTASTICAGVKFTRNAATIAQGVGQEQRPIVLIDEQNANAATETLFVKSAGTGASDVFISMLGKKADGDGTAHGLRIYSNVAQTGPNSGYCMSVAMDNVNSQTGCAIFSSNASPTTPRGCVRITTTGEQRGLYVWTEADTNGDAGVYIDVHGKTNAIYATRNESDADTYLVDLYNNHASSTGGVFHVVQYGTGVGSQFSTINTGININTVQNVTNKNWTTNSVAITGTSIVTDAGTYTKTGAMLSITAAVTETSGSITDSCNVLKLTQSHSHATGAVLVISNSGSGPGIDMSTFSVDKPVLKVVVDTITTAGAVAGQIPIKVGEETYYVAYRAHGT